MKARDLVFSLSSCTSRANIELKREVEQMPCEALQAKSEEQTNKAAQKSQNGNYTLRRSLRKFSGKSQASIAKDAKSANGNGIKWEGDDEDDDESVKSKRAGGRREAKRSKKVKKRNGHAK